jgi:hypothetical protein
MKTDAEFSLLDVFDLPNLQREIVLYLARNGPAEVTALAQATGELPVFAALRHFPTARHRCPGTRNVDSPDHSQGEVPGPARAAGGTLWR